MKASRKRIFPYVITALISTASIFVLTNVNANGSDIKSEDENEPHVKNLLIINASPNIHASYSRMLAKHFVEQLDNNYPGQYMPLYRDLEEEPIPCIRHNNLEAIVAGTETTPEAKALKTLSDRLINELKDSDAIVIATPMHNFTVPAQLKAYLDLILRAGKTFKYSSHGPEGMLEDRPVMMILTSGGCCHKTKYDFLKPYLKHVLSFIGINNVTSVVAEGLGMHDKRESSFTKAKEELKKHVGSFHNSHKSAF